MDGAHREWIENLRENEPHRDRAKLERTRDLMHSESHDALVTGYESRIPFLQLPDINDRHVLAAAIVGRCDVISDSEFEGLPRSGKNRELIWGGLAAPVDGKE